MAVKIFSRSIRAIKPFGRCIAWRWQNNGGEIPQQPTKKGSMNKLTLKQVKAGLLANEGNEPVSRGELVTALKLELQALENPQWKRTDASIRSDKIRSILAREKK